MRPATPHLCRGKLLRKIGFLPLEKLQASLDHQDFNLSYQPVVISLCVNGLTCFLIDDVVDDMEFSNACNSVSAVNGQIALAILNAGKKSPAKFSDLEKILRRAVGNVINPFQNAEHH